MESERMRSWGFVLSLIAAYYFSVLPMPLWAELWRPEWVALVLIYWIFLLPHRVGIFTAWFVGLGLDVLKGVTLGQHALSLSLLAFFAGLLHRRVRFFPAWQQALVVMMLVGIHMVAVRVVQSSVSSVLEGVGYWLPCLVSALIWPWFSVFLGFFHRKSSA